MLAIRCCARFHVSLDLGFVRVFRFCDDPTANTSVGPVLHDTYLRTVVVPLLQAQYCANGGCPIDLIGFSKSGWGTTSLLLTHPTTYRHGAAWDAPSMLSGAFCDWTQARGHTAAPWGMMPEFGSCKVWRKYSPYDLIPHADPSFKSAAHPRLFVGGQHLFGDLPNNYPGSPGAPFNHTAELHARLSTHGVAHRYNDSLDPGRHEWSAVWMAPMLDWLRSAGSPTS